MYLSIYNRRLRRGMMAGAVALVAASACSRSDRAGAGRDTTQTAAVAPADTQANASAQPSTAAQPTTGAQASSGDTATAAPAGDNGKASSKKAETGQRPSRARSTAARTPEPGEQGVAGYKAMGQDSSAASANSSAASVSDTAANADTTATEMAGATSADTATAGAAPMARDTSVALAQGDTAAQAQVDTSSQVQADTATIGDTGVILSRTDTTGQTEVAAGNETDTTAMASDSTQPAERVHPDTVSQKADELAKHEPARVRPPEDSAEVRGNVTTDNSGANADAAAVGAAGMASTGNIATGADAVALMSRQGETCVVVASDQNRDVLWDMASSPSTLNPCGTGTMTLPRIWTGEKK